MAMVAGLLAGSGQGTFAASLADVTISYEERAPKDLFRIANTSLCDAVLAEITIDLAGSVGGLIFDTEAFGAGTNVAQPFVIESGEEWVTATTPVGDGDREVTLTLDAMGPGAAVEFTVDVDDRLMSSPFGRGVVDGSEINGARVTATVVWPSGERQTAEGRFGTDAVARITARPCAMS